MGGNKKVPLKNKLAYGIGTGGGCIFNQIAAAFLLNYYTDTAMLCAGAIATMFLVCRIFDGVTDLIMGGIVDKTSTKLGKARPWLIASAPLSLIGIVLLMNVPMGLGGNGKLVYAYITYIFMNCIVYTIYGISNTALLPLMIRDKDDSTLLATFSALGNNIIGLATGSLITPLVLNLGWKTSSAILGLAACVLILVSGLMNREMTTEDEAKEQAHIPMSQQLPGIFILFLMPVVSKKWNKKTFLLIGSVLIILGFGITGIAGDNTTMIVVGTVIRSLGVGPILSAVFAFVPDVVEYGNRKFGIRSEGLISSAQSIGSKIGIGIGSALTGWILASVGYDPTAKPTAAIISAVKFNPEKYEVKTCELGGRKITYRAFENIVYCKNPVSKVQKLNLFVPEVYYHGEMINGYDLKTAPIFAPNTVGGYMEGPAMEVGIDKFNHKPNTAFEGLLHGYVVMCAGVRGRNTGMRSREFFVGGAGKDNGETEEALCGRAPALIVDMKAAIRYMRHNKGLVPGDVEKIITNGTSAGGALSALAGAIGNAKEYEPYLKAIGAAEERDDIFAASCYCPIHNLEHADAAYEWLFQKETVSHMMRFEMGPNGPKMIPVVRELSEEQKELSKELKASFPAYVNSLNLKDDQGKSLSLDKNGEGSFREYVMQFVLKSATKEKATLDSQNRLKGLAVPGSEIESQDYITYTGEKATGIDTDAYVAKITRMKPTPAFDALDLKSPENEEFGDEKVPARHFTAFSMEHSKAGGEMADPEKIRLLNPTEFIGSCDTTRNWRIRHGAFDRDTSIAIPVILATMLKNKGFNVDFALPWGLPHSGDYDLEELFAWIDDLAK